ncbi:Non-structural maintenance of chromosomes element 1 [Amphibalanus amphitrite]|uniref:Non-structural maintenance of chromosomes element 1 homolog n=2 Tax=Amphibalanus amphitrite TaxID=1232801 RepID=A0A6A4X700_AMPAM|nr:Non-structural maintenance of chromosomes element 1 [Amphibalanus amphitrite]
MEVDCTVDVYGDWHRHFMQAMLSQPAISADGLKKLVGDISGNTIRDLDQIKTFLLTVRSKVHSLGLDLKKGLSERDGRPVYALINTSGGEETVACAAFSEVQLRYLRALIQEVVTSVRGDISAMAALNLADGMPKADAQELLRRLVRDCWLEETDSRLALHTRAILELEPYLLRHYGEHVPRCQMCGKITVRGRLCEQDGCGAKNHHHCLGKMRDKMGVVKCQKCNSLMTDED